MKNILFLTCLTAISISTFGLDKYDYQTPLMGTWKFSKKTVINDYEQIFKSIQEYQSEYYTFEADNVFTHEFFNKEGDIVKTLTGRWKSKNDEIRLKYEDVSFNIILDYHFTNKDLVFGNDLNHVILTKSLIDFKVSILEPLPVL